MFTQKCWYGGRCEWRIGAAASGKAVQRPPPLDSWCETGFTKRRAYQADDASREYPWAVLFAKRVVSMGNFDLMLGRAGLADYVVAPEVSGLIWDWLATSRRSQSDQRKCGRPTSTMSRLACYFPW